MTCHTIARWGTPPDHGCVTIPSAFVYTRVRAGALIPPHTFSDYRILRTILYNELYMYKLWAPGSATYPYLGLSAVICEQ